MNNITSDFYLNIMLQLLPKGKAWALTDDGVFYGILKTTSSIFADVHNKANNLLIELNPNTSKMLIDDYEKLLKLPDICIHNKTDLNLEQRQANAYKKYLSKLTNTVKFLEEYALSLGFNIKVYEITPVRFGEPFSNFSNGNQANIIVVDIHSYPNEQQTHIECEFNKIIPAHIQVFYNYIQT